MKSASVCLILLILVFTGDVAAQVPVHEDPFHKVVLENEYLRLIDGRVPALDTTIMHTHEANSVVVFLSESTFGIQNIGEKPAVAKVKPGDVVYRAYGDTPVNHKVWDKSNSLFHFWVVELRKQRASGDTCSSLSLTKGQLLWQKKLVKAYKLKIDKDADIKLPNSACAYLVMSVTGKISIHLQKSKQSLQSDEYFFSLPHGEMTISSGDMKMAECVLLQLK
jgi:hypothetical protein